MISGPTGVRSSALPALLLALSLPALAPGAGTHAAAQFPPEVRGRVVEAGTGTPVSGAEVRVDGGATSVAGPDGSFTLRGLLPGEHALHVQALGYLPSVRTVVLANGQRTTVRVELRPDPLPIAGVEATASLPDSLPSDALVLGPHRIRESGARDLGDLVAGAPGVTVIRRGGPGAPARASIRGSSGDQVLVLVDGVPVNSPLTGEADLSAVPLEGVERVVVLRGARSVRWGSGALGGVIAVERGGASSRELTLGSRLGTPGEREASLRAGGALPGGRLSGFVDARWHAANGDFLYDVPAIRGGGETRRANARSELLSVAGGGAWRPAGGELRGRAELLTVERGMPGPVVQPSRSGEQDQLRVGASLGARGSLGHGEWRASLDARRQEARLRDPAPPFGPPFDEETVVDGVGAAASVAGDLGPLPGEAGVELRKLDVRSTSLGPGAPDGQETAGVWVQGRLVRGPASSGWRLEASPAVRADWSSLLPGTRLSPGLSLALAGDRVTWRLSARSAFSPPSLGDQFFQEGVLVRPNPELEPERIDLEVQGGVDLRMTETGRPVQADLSVDAYRADVRGMILWLPDFRFVWSPRNVDVRRSGGEVRGRISLPGAGLGLSGSLARSVVEYREPALDGQLPYRPEWTADLELRAVRDPLTLRVAARRTGARRTVPGSETNSLEAFWKLDLRVGGRTRLAGARLEAWLAVENLLDRRASMLVDYPMPGRSWSIRLRMQPFSVHPDPR